MTRMTKAQLLDRITELNQTIRQMREVITAKEQCIASAESLIYTQQCVIEKANEMTDGALSQCVIEKIVYH